MKAAFQWMVYATLGASAACSGGRAAPPPPPPSPSASGANAASEAPPAPQDAGAAAGGDEGVVMCESSHRPMPTFNKACTAATECAGVYHLVDACGTMAAIAINAAERSRYNLAESDCRQGFPPPAAGCQQGPTRAEDGNSTPDRDRIGTDCREGRCVTFVR